MVSTQIELVFLLEIVVEHWMYGIWGEMECESLLLFQGMKDCC